MEKETVTATQYTYTVMFEPNEEGAYTVTCPALPGLVTEGRTLEEARAMAAEAIEGYLEILQEDGRPIPPSEEREAEPVREKVTVHLQVA